MKIISATVGPMPRPLPEGLGDPMPSVTATFEDGTVKSLFRFYPDEISFTPAELVGLTEREALELRRRKDVEWLQS
jgi:hypothetical protein